VVSLLALVCLPAVIHYNRKAVPGLVAMYRRHGIVPF